MYLRKSRVPHLLSNPNKIKRPLWLMSSNKEQNWMRNWLVEIQIALLCIILWRIVLTINSWYLCVLRSNDICQLHMLCAIITLTLWWTPKNFIKTLIEVCRSGSEILINPNWDRTGLLLLDFSGVKSFSSSGTSTSNQNMCWLLFK